MATLTTEMPAEALAGVTTPASSQTSNAGGGPSGSAATNNNPNTSGIDSTQSPETENLNLSTSTNTQNNSSNTISAAADSSDNQPSTPQSQHGQNNDHHPYANHHIYANTQQSSGGATSNSNPLLNHLYTSHIYAQSNMDLQHQQQSLTPNQNSSYPSYLNSYEQFYQQQQQHQQQNTPQAAAAQNQNSQQMDFINSNTSSLFAGTTPSADYKQPTGVRYHPYLQTPTSGLAAINSQTSNNMDNNSQTAPVVSAASSSVMSPRVVSSTSPSSSSNQMHISGSASSIGSMSAGNPSSPNTAGTPQCKKCGIMCTNESELQEHITNVHGASPYGSSGYASSPYIKEELQTPPSQSQQQQQQQTSAGQPTAAQAGNQGEILDLDSQKLLYPPAVGSMHAMMHNNLTNTTDPLHGLHSMQQRAGINTWDQQSQDGLPPYIQSQHQTNSEPKNMSNQSPFYQSPKQSPYHVSNSSNVIKTEYQPIIKTEYPADNEQFMGDKSFDPTAPNQQPQMMPPAVSSSPAEFPSTTTGGPQDNAQQFRGGNFEPPSSSSANVTPGPVGTKAANWKSNEARRPKTYNCTACNKWFTSSGHLKRHYNTTLHKNAVKSSGQPDPATLPISIHHHPARDPSAKSGRGRGSNSAAANAANNNAQQQQQQQAPNPVQPPEPPNSPQEYGGSQVAAVGLTPLSHYSATPSPNSMYQQQQQYQYMSQVQSTTNASPQHAASAMSNHHLHQNQQQQQQQQQQTVLNGHPNALAGLSVPTTTHQQQTPMPSSQMRGLLNTTMPFSTAKTTVHITKIEHLEAATMDRHNLTAVEEEELGYLSNVEVKQEYLVEEEQGEEELQRAEHIIYTPKAVVEQESEEELYQQQLQAAQGHREVDHNAERHHNTTSLQIHRYQLEAARQEDRLYHNTTPNNTPNNMPAHSPLIISHQQYLEQQQAQHQMVAQDTYSLTQTPPPPQQQQLPHSTMGQQDYINTPMVTNMPLSPNNTLQQPLSLITTEQRQLPPATTIRTTNMVSMLPLSHHHTLLPPPQLTELQPLANMSLQLDTINTNIPSPISTITNNTTNIPSYHQLQHPGSMLPQLDHTLTYPHNIIGNHEILTLDPYGNLVTSSGQHVLQTTDGQLLQLITTPSSTATSLYTTQPYDQYMAAANKSPQEGDLPPHFEQDSISANISSELTPPSSTSSPIQGHSDSSEMEYKESFTEDFLNKHFTAQNASDYGMAAISKQPESATVVSSTTSTKATTTTTSANKRKRNPSSSSSVGANSTILPSGRIKCLPCDKEFTKICYLTQHNKSFHSEFSFSFLRQLCEVF